MKKRKKIQTFDIVNTTLVVLITLLITYPLYFVLIASFSDPLEVGAGNTVLWIKGFTLESYKLVMENKLIWTGYRNSLIYSTLATFYYLVLLIPAGYAMSKKDLPFRNIISWYFFITMYLSGGLIPFYLLMKSLHLVNNPMSQIVATAIGAYNLIVVREYFNSSIEAELYSAAKIDGAGEGKCFLSIALPLAKPIVAVMGLWTIVGNWNSFTSALIYLRDSKYYPLQLVLRNLIFEAQMAVKMNVSIGIDELQAAVYRAKLAQTMKYSVVIVAAIPMLMIYPFVQKYFVKGIMIGSVKG